MTLPPFLPFLKRRLWLISNRMVPTVAAALILPIIIHASVNLSLRNIVVRSLRHIAYDQWVYPGLVFIIGTLIIFSVIFRDLFDLRVHQKALLPMALSPVTKWNLLAGLCTAAVLEALVFVIIGMIILTILMPIELHGFDQIIILAYFILYSLIVVNLAVTLSLSVNRISLAVMTALVVFIFLIFGSGLLVETEFFPSTVGVVFRQLPTSMVIHGLRMALFSEIFTLWHIVGPLIIGIVWLVLNSIYLQRKLVP